MNFLVLYRRLANQYDSTATADLAVQDGDSDTIHGYFLLQYKRVD